MNDEAKTRAGVCSTENDTAGRTPLAARSGGAGWTVLAGLGVFVLALVVRLVYLHQSAANPTFSTPIVDSDVYDDMARQVVDGKGFDNFFWQPAFYPFFLSVVYFFSDSSILWAKITQAVLGSLTCVLTFWLGVRVFNRRVGLLAGLLAACYGPLVFFDGELLASGWAAFWSVALVLLFLRAQRTRSPQTCFWLGVCALLAVLTRPTFAVFVAAAGVWLAVKFLADCYRWRTLARCVPAFLAGMLLVYFPAARLRERVTGHYGITPYSGGINFYIGNNPDMCQTLTIRPGIRWAQFTQLPERNGIAPDNWKKQSYFYGLVRSYLREHPLDFAKGLARKGARFVSSRETPRNVDIYLFAQWSSLLNALTWKVGGFGFPFGVVLPLACVGVLWSGRRIPVPMVLLLILLPASVVLVFVTARYRVAVVPLVLVLAAQGAAVLVDLVRRGAWGRVGISLSVIAATVLAATLPGPFCEELPDYRAELFYILGTKAGEDGKVDQAIQYYQKTLDIDPDLADALNNLGAEYYDRGQLEEAVRYFSRAAELEPDGAATFLNLAAAYYKQGRVDAAINAWKQVLRINPRDGKVHYLLGNALLGQNKLDEAVHHYVEALKVLPNHRRAASNLGVAYERQGRLEAALTQYRRAVRIDPQALVAHANIVKVLIKLNRCEEAVQACVAALKVEPNVPEILYQYGRALECLGNPREAATRYQAALRLNPAHAGARQRLQALVGRTPR